MTGASPNAALVDLDGTVLSGESVIDGAARGIERLRSAGLPVLFLTNRATHAAEAHASTLREAGIEARASDVLTAGEITAAGFDPDDGPAYVLGTAALRAAIVEAGTETVADPTPEAVGTVVASAAPALDFERLTAATRAVDAGARFVATNPDGARPTPAGLCPEAGAVAAALTAATGRRPTVFGKPNRAVAEAAVTRLRENSEGTLPPDFEPSQFLVIGDNPSTDVELGRRIECPTVLVGAGPPGDAREDTANPDYRIDSLTEIAGVLEALGCA
jgi:HAD superfamily hydrolase (TIGR01450 family)